MAYDNTNDIVISVSKDMTIMTSNLVDGSKLLSKNLGVLFFIIFKFYFFINFRVQQCVLTPLKMGANILLQPRLRTNYSY